MENLKVYLGPFHVMFGYETGPKPNPAPGALK